MWSSLHSRSSSSTIGRSRLRDDYNCFILCARVTLCSNETQIRRSSCRCKREKWFCEGFRIFIIHGARKPARECSYAGVAAATAFTRRCLVAKAEISFAKFRRVLKLFNRQILRCCSAYPRESLFTALPTTLARCSSPCKLGPSLCRNSIIFLGALSFL